MNFVDLHCDTAGKIYYENSKLKSNNFSIDLEKLKRGKCLGQVFAIFVDQKLNLNTYEEFKNIYDKFYDEVNTNSDLINIVTNINELKKTNNEGKIGAFLSIEEGEVIQGKIENLKKVYDLGIRIVTITWNYKNSLGYPNFMFKHKDDGLTNLGVESIKECEEMGIIPDVSHLSDKGFYDVLNTCTKPFVASHSNARSITNHPRNLTDDMIRKLSDKGGVMGLNFCSDFLGDKDYASLEDIVKHAKHIKKVGGIDVLSLGSDFDGIDNKVEFDNAGNYSMLYNELKKNKFTEDDIEKIFYKNVIRVFKETLK